MLSLTTSKDRSGLHHITFTFLSMLRQRLAVVADLKVLSRLDTSLIYVIHMVAMTITKLATNFQNLKLSKLFGVDIFLVFTKGTNVSFLSF